MNILLLGSGGREHAFAWKIAQSPLLSTLFIAPGNAGTSLSGTNVPISVQDFNAIVEFLQAEKIDMLVVGPEAPLVDGLADHISNNPATSHIRVIGPPSSGARLEGSKVFAKAFMQRHGIPTAASHVFDESTFSDAVDFVHSNRPPFVLKADGLAAGKGVVICQRPEEAIAELEEMLIKGKFGKASQHILIEEYLQGVELSAFVITDGQEYLILPEAKDYKRIGEGDTGPNTGGMGSVSPVPFADKAWMNKVEERIIQPTIRGLKAEHIPYAGFIFFGLMNVNGNPYLIEYNVRMGDPETEAIIPRLKNDLLELFQAVFTHKLSQVAIETDPRACAAVMLVSAGYPGSYQKGKTITVTGNIENSILFHAGTRQGAQPGEVLTDGGRVIAIVSLAASLPKALGICYKDAGNIHFEGMYYRKDIGKDLQ